MCDRRHVNTGMMPAQQLEPLVDYIVKEKGRKKGYMLAADYNYGQITAKWMKKLLARGRRRGRSAAEFFPLDVTNFAPAIARIQAAKPDVVWSALVGGAHIAFYRQFEATIGKKNMPLASTTYGVGREQTELVADEGDGIMIATSFVDDPADPGRQGVRREVPEIRRRGRICRRVWRIRLSRHDAVGRSGQEGRLA